MLQKPQEPIYEFASLFVPKQRISVHCWISRAHTGMCMDEVNNSNLEGGHLCDVDSYNPSSRIAECLNTNNQRIVFCLTVL